MCVVGDREMCVCVSERRKERSDKATQRGRGTQDGETEEEIERKKGKNKRWKRRWKDVGWGCGGTG